MWRSRSLPSDVAEGHLEKHDLHRIPEVRWTSTVIILSSYSRQIAVPPLEERTGHRSRREDGNVQHKPNDKPGVIDDQLVAAPGVLCDIPRFVEDRLPSYLTALRGAAAYSFVYVWMDVLMKTVSDLIVISHSSRRVLHRLSSGDVWITAGQQHHGGCVRARPRSSRRQILNT